MEALVFIFAEILFACMMPLLALAGAAMGLVLELLAAVFGGIFLAMLESRRAKKVPDQPVKPRKPLIPRKVIHWSAGILLSIGVLSLVASFVFFQPILRYVIDSAAQKAGMQASYSKAEGTLIKGDVTLSGLHLIRKDDTGLAFDLEIDRVQADVDVWSLLSAVPVITMARVDGVTGFVSPPPRDKDKPRKKRRPFRAGLLQASGVDVEVRPKTSDPYSLLISEAQVAPFRSSLALFDLLFRSNMKAQIAGQDLIVQTRNTTEFGRETLWDFSDVEAEKVKLLVPKAPLTWLDGGTVNVRVEDRWSLSDDWIEMDWFIGLDGVRVEVPRDAGTTEKLLGRALAKLVNAKNGNADFRYQLTLDKAQIEALRGGDLDQFWDTVLDGFLVSGGKGLRSDEGQSDSPDAGDDKPGVLDKLKGLFDRESSD